jgi:hypothetical protein
MDVGPTKTAMQIQQTTRNGTQPGDEVRSQALHDHAKKCSMSISSYGLQPHRRSSVGDLSSKSISPTCLGLLESQTILHMSSYKESAPTRYGLILLNLNNSTPFHTLTTSSFIDTTSTSNHAFQSIPPPSPHRCRLRPTNRIVQGQRCLRQRRVPLVLRYDVTIPPIPTKTSTNELHRRED